jgi:uncharacterized protein
VRVVRTTEFENPAYLANGQPLLLRKHELFEELAPLAQAGALWCRLRRNASDVGDFRPGAQAAKEFQVRAPLKEVGLTKAEIRELSAQLGLPTADKPQMACLSSRIPHGEPVTTEKLRMIEAAENVLKDFGFYDVRVRHHELGVPGARGQVSGEEGAAIPDTSHLAPRTTSLARIEVGAAELPKFLENGLSVRVAEALKKIGYAHVTLDLLGYRRGSLNKTSGSFARQR